MLLRIVALAAFALLVLVLPAAVALAHGTPELTVKEQQVAPGGTVTLSGDALGENGDTCTLTLKGATYQAKLGTVMLKDDTFDETMFTIPKDAPAGTYVIDATNGTISAQTQLEVTGTTGAAASSSTGTMAQTEAATEPRPWTPLEWAVGIALVVLTGALAVILLWRSRDELTVIS
jgi:hypothetical protein